MLQFQFYLLLLATAVWMYQQSDYKVVSERFEFEANDSLIGNLKYVNFKHNRSFHALNVSWTKRVDFDNDLKVVVQGYKFASNEYRFFPIVFDTTACQCLNGDIFGVRNVYKCGHAPVCPFKKGSYNICNWQPDFNKFPPYVPSASYRLDFNFTYRSQLAIYAQWYMTVKRDIPWQ